jgi:putative serine/threonine protein kinase
LNNFIPVSILGETEAIRVLSWPRFYKKIAEERLEEIKELHVEAISMEGAQVRSGLGFIGKGHVGLVVESIFEGKRVALKIRRTDADRPGLEREAQMLEKANSVNVGPKLCTYSRNFIVMELIEGAFLRNWIIELDEEDSDILKDVLRRILDKARRLDRIGLDHGELSRIKRHIIVMDTNPRIIDFESASINRRPSNVTSVTNFIFINRWMNDKIGKVIFVPTFNQLIEVLRRYKKNRTEKNYDEIVKTCKLG